MRAIAFDKDRALKIAGKFSKYEALDPVFLDVQNGTEYYFLPEDVLKAVNISKSVKDKIRALIKSGEVKLFDTEDTSDSLTQKYLAIQSESEAEQTTRLAKRTATWDYSTKNIEL